ncbi:Adaptor complexes medium subunit family protein [Babesia bovis T2Bo]|uniref:Mu1 adaptin n=1 Tax=Babesia bovis TaxID=5865 RepID=A7AS30_BABBO|nr:Adaptor complexes medium subunit family protein [Babesia bovis T2Bo]EDO07349.1 Adaptor complexes medium subunit family protein [Babesia bovis T2Bo]|eukprot:XP_001610917.1 mu1 adaptin [Babesia bovis T2Bo]
MGGISGIYILDGKGRLMINRKYKDDVINNLIDSFYANVLLKDENAVTPVYHCDGCTFCWIRHNELYFVAAASTNYNVAMVLAFLYRFVKVLESYFKILAEDTVRDNFVIIYELLDEMIDNGYPQATEESVLKECIRSGKSQVTTDAVTPPSAMTNVVSWRKEGIHHKKNEVFLDVIESLDILLSPSGAVLRSEIKGRLQMKSFLSGMPHLFLGLNDKSLFENASSASGSFPANQSYGKPPPMRTVEMEDVKFHQCVQLERFESDRAISFIPPDGEFELMTYRVNCHVKPLFSCDVIVNNNSSTRIDFTVRATSRFKSKSIANNVEFEIPVPSDVQFPNLKTSIGTVKYMPDMDAVLWSIKEFQGEKEFVMYASFGLPSVSDGNRGAFSKRNVKVKYEIPYFTVSGVSVKHLRITEKSGYQALPWVRYITKNGDYQIKMS